MVNKLELKVGIFLVISAILIAISLVYVAYKKGFFSESHEFYLYSSSGDGLTEGTPLVFSGFQIGKVTKLDLSDEGLVLITLQTPKEHAKWIRESSSFMLDNPLIGFPKIIVQTNDFHAPILTKSKTVQVQKGYGVNEAIQKIQPLIERAEIIVRNVESTTNMMADKTSVAAMMSGNNESGLEMQRIIKKSSELSSVLHTLVDRADRIAQNTNEQLYGDNGMVLEMRSSLKKLDEILVNGRKITADTAATTDDLVLLRSDVEQTIQSANSLLHEIEAKIPMKTQKEVTLP